MLGGEQDCYGGCTDAGQGYYGLLDEVSPPPPPPPPPFPKYSRQTGTHDHDGRHQCTAVVNYAQESSAHAWGT